LRISNISSKGSVALKILYYVDIFSIFQISVFIQKLGIDAMAKECEE